MWGFLVGRAWGAKRWVRRLLYGYFPRTKSFCFCLTADKKDQANHISNTYESESTRKPNKSKGCIGPCFSMQHLSVHRNNGAQIPAGPSVNPEQFSEHSLLLWCADVLSQMQCICRTSHTATPITNKINDLIIKLYLIAIITDHAFQFCLSVLWGHASFSNNEILSPWVLHGRAEVWLSWGKTGDAMTQCRAYLEECNQKLNKSDSLIHQRHWSRANRRKIALNAAHLEVQDTGKANDTRLRWRVVMQSDHHRIKRLHCARHGEEPRWPSDRPWTFQQTRCRNRPHAQKIERSQMEAHQSSNLRWGLGEAVSKENRIQHLPSLHRNCPTHWCRRL